MFRTIFAATRIVVGVIEAKLKLSSVKKIPKDLPVHEQDRIMHQFPDYFGKMMIGCTGSKVKVEGIENIPRDEGVLIVSNHQSNFDIPLLLGYLNKPIGFIAKAELKKLPIVPDWMEQMHSVFMDRSDRRQSLNAIKEGIDKLKNGHSLVIFPEGTRSKSSEIGEFKSGSLHLATKSGVPVIPVRIEGTYNILEANGNRIKPANVTLKVFPPVYPEQIGITDPKELTNYIKDIIEK
jgi:1-acyl-sn-glycerol-3-phosphate acyltransferase